MRFTTRRHSPPSSLHHFAHKHGQDLALKRCHGIQKTLADKLSDKVQVIIAPTPAAGHVIGSNLVGNTDGQAESQ
jgi:hypothetical protein